MFCHHLLVWQHQSHFKSLNMLIKKTGSDLGTSLEMMEQREIIHHMKNISNNPLHCCATTVSLVRDLFRTPVLQTTTGDQSTFLKSMSKYLVCTVLLLLLFSCLMLKVALSV